jgi:hypothetical protein
MSDGTLFVLVFGGLFFFRGVAATVVFLWILPDGIRCPQCDAETTSVQPGFVLRYLTRFRSSWCLECGWHGVHRVTKRARESSEEGADTAARSTNPIRRP